MTHDELLAKIDAYHKTCLSGGSDKDVPKSYNWSCYNLHAMARTLREVIKYAKELSQTDYRGNPPPEHYIAKELHNIIEKELV